MRPQCAAGKGRIFHDDLHAFSSGGILFVNNGALRKERVSDGLLFQLEGKVGRRRHVPIEVTRRRQ